MSDTELLTLAEARTRYTGPLVTVVLDWLAVMERVVNQDKQPAIPASEWDALGALLDPARFRRVGNYGVKNDWASYRELLDLWANFSWWQGLIGRVREVPGTDGAPSLVYMETEERSNRSHPVRDDGDYDTLASIAVYGIDDNHKVVSLHVYDQRPL